MFFNSLTIKTSN